MGSTANHHVWDDAWCRGLGLTLGLILGALLDNIGAGMALGIACGAALGALFERQDARKRNGP